MWYRSEWTGKIIHSSAAKVINAFESPYAFDNAICAGFLVEVTPSVIDVLRDTGSTKLAVLRYREIHHCDAREARRGIKLLKKAMARNQKKGRKTIPIADELDAAKRADE